LDPNPNPGGPVNPTPDNSPTDATGHAAEVFALKGWLRENAFSLVITAAAIAAVCIYLDPIDTLKVMIGLGLVIFLHELGHFLAAKWCDAHVKTFSIGFGPAVPFCSYKWGETTYMVGIIPLGGYVAMVGEGDNAGEDDAEEDPRSFRHKTVGQRMLIISAGVVMNLILGMACFVAVYMHGVQEKPATIGGVESGGAAWRVGIRADDDITKISNREKPFFNDIRPVVMSARKGQEIDIVVQRPGQSESETYRVEPLRGEGQFYPQLGVRPPDRLTLLSLKKGSFRPAIPGSTAAAAKDPAFEPGDRIIAMTDLDAAKGVTALRPDPKDPSRPDFADYSLRMEKLAAFPITFGVRRKDQPDDASLTAITVQPAYRSDLGVRMRMGEVIALRRGGPAEKAQVVTRSETPPTTGDRIKTVKFPEAGGKETWLTTGALASPNATTTVRRLDPVLLPLELKAWADRNPDVKTVKLEVLRKVEHQENRPLEVSVDYDRAFRYDREIVSLPNSPVPLGGLGLAYWVEAVVDEVEAGGPAATAGLKLNDVVTAARFKSLGADGNVKPGNWDDIKAHQWASAESAFQSRPPYDIDLKVKRGEEIIEVTMKGRDDKRWPTDDRGLVFQADFRTQKATDFGDAFGLGAWRVVRFVREVYMNLGAMIFGQVSAKTMSGPLTIANVSYKFAGEDFWQFLLFLGMISVNLAVVNFLPIPVLDGGHMVFLILEWILGRPVPERIFAAAMWTGLAMILSLMVFVIYLDVKRMFF